MLEQLKKLWESSDFAKENLSFRETVGLILEKHGFASDSLLLGKEINCPDIIRDFERAVLGEPLGYILGKIPFYREEYFVEEGVLIPRCDSEAVVEAAVKHIPKNTHFLDICTGSGCLGISILRQRSDLSATLLDVSEISQRVAQKNIARLGVSDRCSFRLFNLFEDCDKLCDFSAVVMNPPYVTTSELLELPENVKKEPVLALDGGDDGLKFYRFVAENKIFDGKTLIFEIGYKQGKALTEMFSGGEIIKDLSGNDRIFLKTKE